MKRKFLFTLNVLFVVLSSCGEYSSTIVENKTHDTINVLYEMKIEKDIPFSILFSQIKYYPIPTDDKFLIGKVDKLLIEDSLFFILDKKIAHSVFIFDKKGNKKLLLNKQGRGPGEYVNICNVSYNNKEQTICLYCNMRKRLIHYGLDGNLISEQKLSINSIIAEPIGKYVAMHTEYHKNEELEDDGKYPNLILIDPISQEICSTQNFFSTPIKQTIVWSTGCWFSSWDDTLSIKPDHSNIVYHIANDSIYPAYLLDFGLYNIDNRYWDKALETNISLQQVDDYCNNLGLCEIFKFLESKDYIYFVFKQKQKMRHVLISKKTKKKYIIESLKNDIDDITIFFPKAINGNKLYCLIDANNIMLLKKSLKGKLPQTLLDSVQESDNPIIAELPLKEF